MNELDYQTYHYIAEYIGQRGYSPLQSEIADALHIDRQAVQEQILRLWNFGYLCHPPHTTGTLYLSTQEISQQVNEESAVA